MNLTIKPLTSELSDDYFDFFENRAFTDDSPYRCYCQVYQMSAEQQREEIANTNGADPGTISKHVAQKQINSGVLRGYLAYADGVSIGWCTIRRRRVCASSASINALYVMTALCGESKDKWTITSLAQLVKYAEEEK